MILDKSNMKDTVIKNFKGGLGELAGLMYMDKEIKILNTYLTPGSTIGKHRHETSHEIIFITAGKGKAVCDGVEEELEPGKIHFCHKGSEHELINTGDTNLEFFAVVPEL